jgi:hypothetical protein
MVESARQFVQKFLSVHNPCRSQKAALNLPFSPNKPMSLTELSCLPEFNWNQYQKIVSSFYNRQNPQRKVSQSPEVLSIDIPAREKYRARCISIILAGSSASWPYRED